MTFKDDDFASEFGADGCATGTLGRPRRAAAHQGVEALCFGIGWRGVKLVRLAPRHLDDELPIGFTLLAIAVAVGAERPEPLVPGTADDDFESIGPGHSVIVNVVVTVLPPSSVVTAW